MTVSVAQLNVLCQACSDKSDVKTETAAARLERLTTGVTDE